MEEAVARDVVPLREKEICFILGIDVRDAPAIPEDLDRLNQTGYLEFFYRCALSLNIYD